MDNKKWGKRFSTIFWWTLAILPFLIALVYFVGYHLTFNSGISTAQELFNYHELGKSFANILTNVANNFEDWTISWLTTAWEDLFNLLNVTENSLGIYFAWATQVFLIHVIFDVLVWLPRFLHCLMERYDV